MTRAARNDLSQLPQARFHRSGWPGRAIHRVMPLTKLAPDEISKRLSKLPEWSLDKGKLHRSYQFSNFI